MNFLKWCRVAIATCVLAAVVALFLDFSETVPRSWHWILHCQVTQLVLAGLWPGLLLIVGLTAILGRSYCSVLCPYGVTQDIFARIGRFFRGKKRRYQFRPEMKKTRYALLGLFFAGLIGMFFVPGVFAWIVMLLDPYSNFGRIANTFLVPAYLAGNNFFAWMMPDSWYYQGIYITASSLIIAIAALLLVGTLSFFFGRRYCNTICPIGTFLGLISRFSLFNVRLKSDCISCGLCEKSCKGECIDSKNQSVDTSRCVACFNCLSTCKRGSIVYSVALPPSTKSEQDSSTQQHIAAGKNVSMNVTDQSRRRFVQGSLFSIFMPSFIASLGASRSNSPPPDPSLPSGTSRIGYEMTIPILPPGAQSRKHLQSKCTGCQLCVSKCPANIIVPSSTELGLGGFMQPILKFDHGFCNYDCTICTEVCPSHALQKIDTKEEKHLVQFGRVVFLQKNCVVETEMTNCGACAEHCPTGAVSMVPYKDSTSLTIPVTDPDLCIGCGACEYICPVRPYRAIYVEGLEVHRQAKPAYDPNAKQEEAVLDDFWF